MTATARDVVVVLTVLSAVVVAGLIVFSVMRAVDSLIVPRWPSAVTATPSALFARWRVLVWRRWS